LPVKKKFILDLDRANQRGRRVSLRHPLRAFFVFPRFSPFFRFDGPGAGKNHPFAGPLFTPSKAEIWVGKAITKKVFFAAAKTTFSVKS